MTECLAFHATAEDVQDAINDLALDVTEDGEVDYHDQDHVQVTREGDGTAASGFGYTYTVSFAGRPHYRGLSTVLGAVDELKVVGVGSDSGCSDVAATVEQVLGFTLDTLNVSRFEGTRSLVPSSDVRGKLRPGDRIRIAGSLDESQIYTVSAINGQQAITLASKFHCGSACGATKKVTLVVAGGVPDFNVDTIVDGRASWSYDIFFTAPTFGNVNPLVVVDEGRSHLLTLCHTLSLFLSHSPSLTTPLTHPLSSSLTYPYPCSLTLSLLPTQSPSPLLTHRVHYHPPRAGSGQCGRSKWTAYGGMVRDVDLSTVTQGGSAEVATLTLSTKEALSDPTDEHYLLLFQFGNVYHLVGQGSDGDDRTCFAWNASAGALAARSTSGVAGSEPFRSCAVAPLPMGPP